MTAERKALPVIDTTRCTGCGWCVAACPPKVMSLETEGGIKTATLHDEPGCTGCALCAVKCPFGVIAMVRIPDRAATRCAQGSKEERRKSSARQPTPPPHLKHHASSSAAADPSTFKEFP